MIILLSLPAILASVLLPTLLDGVERKIKALVHTRIGPPILQSWYDIIKLFNKEYYIPLKSLHTLALVLSALLVTVFTIAYTCISILEQVTPYDLLVITVLVAISQTIFIAIPLTIPNPYSIIGASRELLIMLVNEGIFLVLASLYIYYTGIETLTTINTASFKLYLIPILLALLIVSYVGSGRVPFDIAEAEPELASGLLIELSGPLLGAYLLTMHLKRFLFKLYASILILGVLGFHGIVFLYSALILAIIIWIIYALIAAMLGRSRVDLASITLLKIYLVLIALSLIGYFLGV